MLNEIELSELLMIKFCHDLSGPVGAINNGAELLQDCDDSLQGQAVDLIETSAKDVIARLLFFRQAYGSANDKSATEVSTLKDLSVNFLSSKKVRMIWMPESANLNIPASVSGSIGKILLNMIILTAASLVYGGDISIYLSQEQDKTSIRVRGEGKMVKVDKEISDILKGKDSEINVKNINAYLVSRLIEKQKAKSELVVGKDYVEMSVA